MSSEDAWLVRAQNHLEQALTEGDPSEKNFYIRKALQELNADNPQND